jgi:hypothetical protein
MRDIDKKTNTRQIQDKYKTNTGQIQDKYRTRHEKTTQDKSQTKTRQDNARHNRTRQDKSS